MTNPNDATDKFQQIAKGSILASIENKHIQYINMADRRAQGILTISSILIPFSITKIESPQCQYGVYVFLGGAVITIISSILCLTPKKYRRGEKDRRHPLHFSGITQFTKDEFIDRMASISQNTSDLNRELAIDMYHISHDVLVPKFFYLRIAYTSFVGGTCLSLGLVLNGYLNLV